MSAEISVKNFDNSKKIADTAKKYLLLAEEQRNENRHQDAVKNYLLSILMDKNNPVSYIGLADAYKNLKNYKKALYYLKKAEVLQPDSAEIKRELSKICIITGDFCIGIKYLTDAIKLEPDNYDLQMQLALVHEMIEEEDMALMIYQKIIENNPDYIRAYIQKATLYMHLEDYLNSAKMFKIVLKKSPDYFRAYLGLGISYDKLNNPLAAKRYYKKYLSSNQTVPNHINVNQRISNLQIKKQVVSKLRLVN
ncbi:tetratricopeptide repeat protein [bacterium]|nr:tetratricopeptide repeat protein [bacterium]